ncbi:hypothetical protein ANN_15326 [Periplaneta americana]|uniref:Uncharacterized protein n=1 Tax=Periplaneta americana TaxID=6978 RepID=A0ABQ8SGQ9_PERAM|nr:hypothetical protein ANN_15326 [Periplaneta americana]
MAGLCEGGIEPAGSLKAICKSMSDQGSTFTDIYHLRTNRGEHLLQRTIVWASRKHKYWPILDTAVIMERELRVLEK